MITEGETSEPYYFTTLPTSPPSKDECVSSWDSITFKWNNPTTGMVNGTVYRYAYSLSQGSSGMAKGMMNTCKKCSSVPDQCTLLFLIDFCPV